MLGLIVPVVRNFRGVAELFHSVDFPIRPFVIDNWTENLGVSGGWNLGMKMAIEAGIERVIVPNDDVTFYPGTLETIYNTLADKVFVTPTSLNGGKPWDKEEYVEAPDFSCWAARPADLVDAVGWFDEGFFPAYFEDNDMHWRMRMAGLPGSRRLDTYTWHQGSATNNVDRDNPVVNEWQFMLCQNYYLDKWGGLPGAEKYATPFNDPSKDYKWVKQDT